MKKKLADIFKDKCVTSGIPGDAENYHWYLNEENEPIGISKDISHIERQLIELNYSSINVDKFTDPDKLIWFNFLTKQAFSKIPVNTTGSTAVKFIFFFHDFDPDLQLAFESLVQDFNSGFKVFFLESSYGVVVDLAVADDQVGEIDDVLLASKQDFSTALTFYQTVGYEINERLPEKFRAEFDLFKKFKNVNQSLMNHKDLFLNYMVSREVVDQHLLFGEWFKQLFLIDTELLAAVKCYLEHGFNVTTGSKVMHMHRNTFMNKLDRFIEMTGLDVKKFDEAAIAYVLIRLRRDV